MRALGPSFHPITEHVRGMQPFLTTKDRPRWLDFLIACGGKVRDFLQTLTQRTASQDVFFGFFILCDFQKSDSGDRKRLMRGGRRLSPTALHVCLNTVV